MRPKATITARWRHVWCGLSALWLAFGVIAVVPQAHAAHHPWDQGHDPTDYNLSLIHI